jgi:hypothetical protein
MVELLRSYVRLSIGVVFVNPECGYAGMARLRDQWTERPALFRPQIPT